MDMPVDEPGEDETTDSVDNLGPTTESERRIRANLSYLPAADHDPAVWSWLTARAVDQRAVLNDEDIVWGRAHDRLQRSVRNLLPVAPYVKLRLIRRTLKVDRRKNLRARRGF
jgi:hypothetical protein